MSLSFVSKSVLTAKADGGYEETAVEGKEGEGDSSSNSRATSAQPLFEQLRKNKEQEEEEREEFQKSIMRGTLALDEEDCAHLDAIQQQRHEKEQLIRNQTRSELEAFRAAQAVSRMEQGVMKDEEDDDNEVVKKDSEQVKKPQKKQAVPPPVKIKPKFPIVVAKKRRKQPTEKNEDEPAKKPKKEEAKKPEAPAEKPSLSGLLAGYGSDSDSD